MPLVAPEVWEAVAQRLEEHHKAGRGHLLTEDVLRFATVVELQKAGIDAARMRPEHPVPAVAGKLDLVIDDPPTVGIEFKFPRDSRTGPSPDPMTLGELLKDYFRLAHLDIAERWIIQVLNDRVRRYLARRSEMRWVWDAGEMLSIPPNLIATLPVTTQRVFSTATWMTHGSVEAQSTGSYNFAGWTLTAYEVLPQRPLVSAEGGASNPIPG